MKKIVIFNGSPRKDGNNSTILNLIERGAKEHHAEVKSYTLFKMKMSACVGCYHCQTSEDHSCILTDEMTKAIEDIKEADAVVIGSPIYFFQINGMTKNLYDRMFPLWGRTFGEKKIVTVYTQEMGDPNMNESYFQYLEMTMLPGFGFTDVHRIVACNASNPAAADENEALKKEAYEVGAQLAKG